MVFYGRFVVFTQTDWSKIDDPNFSQAHGEAGKRLGPTHVDDKELGTIDSASPTLETSFTGHLLIQAVKEYKTRR